MHITTNNIQRTFQQLRPVESLLEEARTLVIGAHTGSARQMSSAELEFALRKTANGLINLHAAFSGFLERIERDSRQQR